MNTITNITEGIHIIGAGLSGLSAAITLASNGIRCNLISVQPSERAQSVLAEGGINAALDTMGEQDTVSEHYADTMRGGCNLESEQAVRGLTEQAPEIVRMLVRLGVPFQREQGKLVLRNFGGQKKKRTAYAKSSTGKMIMTALIDEARRYEAAGLITRYPHHELIGMTVENQILSAITVKDIYSRKALAFFGTTILCTGGLNGFFEGMTTGTTQNTGNAAAIAFDCGVEFANLEYIQYHPTTIAISGKRMLISEAARGEGGRLFLMRNGTPWYFMEEKYPELGNLMPRDVVSREMVFALQEEGCTGDVYLDMTGLKDTVWDQKLSDLRNEILAYLHLDPKKEPIAVRPGIHFFMGGIRVNDRHETNIQGLYAAGEAACKYHGANRLGGNSMLGAIYGGQIVANAILSDLGTDAANEVRSDVFVNADTDVDMSMPQDRYELRDLLLKGLGIVRSPEVMQAALTDLERLYQKPEFTGLDRKRTCLGMAMLRSALARQESRGAHYRVDYPDTKEDFCRQTRAIYENGEIHIRHVAADE